MKVQFIEMKQEEEKEAEAKLIYLYLASYTLQGYILNNQY